MNDPRATKLLEMKAAARNGSGTPPAPDPDPPARTCPDCGKPCHPANNRCYACRPGGGAGKPRPAEAEAPQDDAGPRRPRKAPAPAAIADPELAAIAAMMDALEPLDVAAARRALSYVVARLKLGQFTAPNP